MDSSSIAPACQRPVGALWPCYFALLFPLGWTATCARFADFHLEYLALTLLSMFAYLIFATCSHHAVRDNLLAWSLAAAFLLVYYVKFYILVLYPEILHSIGSTGSLAGTFPPSQHALLRVYQTITYGFLAFALTASIFTTHWRAGEILATERHTASVNMLWTVSLFAAFALGARVWLFYHYGVILNGHPSLPQHLAAITEFFGAAAISLAGLVILDHGTTIWWRCVGLTILTALAIADMLLLTTKGSLATLALSVAALWVIERQPFTRRHCLFLGGCAAAMILLYPAMITMRAARLSGSGIFTTLQATSDVDPTSIAPVAASAPQMVFSRLPGADALLVLVERHVTPLGIDSVDLWFSRGSDIEDYVSYDLFNFPVTLMPSLFGEYYVMGGDTGVIIGIIGFTLIALCIWKCLQQLGSADYLSVRAIKAVFLSSCVGIALEGGSDYLVSRAWPLMAIAAVGMELLLQCGHLTACVGRSNDTVEP